MYGLCLEAVIIISISLPCVEHVLLHKLPILIFTLEPVKASKKGHTLSLGEGRKTAKEIPSHLFQKKDAS